MALKYLQFDTVKNKQVAAVGTPGAPVSEHFDVPPGSGQQYFVITVGTFDSNTRINIFRNGIKTREGASYDWTRNVALNRVDFAFPVTQNAWVEAELYLYGMINDADSAAKQSDGK